MKIKPQKLTLLSAMLGTALMLSFLEAVLPLGFLLPGFKLGISNIIILLVLKTWGFKEAIAINLVRIFITALLFGNVFGLVLSLAGGISSTLLMFFLLKIKGLSSIGVSSAAGAMHNLAQLGASCILLNTFSLQYLASLLLILGGITGAVCGIGAYFAEKRLKNINFA